MGKFPVAVMSHGLWARRFGSDPGIVGNTVKLNGSAFTVVGVAAEGFKGLSVLFGPDFWVPTMMYRQILPAQFQDWFESRRLLFINIAGRLEPGVFIEEAEANMKTIASALEQEYPEPNGGRSVVLLPLAEATIFPGIRGRQFNLADREDSVPVAILNEAMAERFWPGEDALGKRFKFYGDDEFQEVIGIVETVKIVTLGEDPQPCAYLSMKQRYNDTMTLYLRAEAEPGAILGAARREVRALAVEIPITNVWTVSEVIDQSLFAPKLGAALLAVLGLLALALASVGLYGVMAYTVNQRDHEIGLRMALGARQRDVLRLILKQAMTLVGVGMGIGLALSLAVTSMVSNLLYGISPADPATFLGVTTLLVTVALLATLVPAHRASRVDPLVALRYE